MNKRCTGCFEYYDDIHGLCPYCGRCEGEPAKELFQLDPGTIIRENLEDRYIIGNLISFGGFGITYKAWDIHMEKVVAIKEHFPSQGGLAHRIPGTKTVSAFNLKRKAEYEASVERFKAEAHFMAKFNSHKNIVNVFNCCEDNGTAYLCMEYLDGWNLSEYTKMRGGRLSVEETLKIAFAVIDALKDVHKAGVLHRDIAPDNIFITKDGRIKLIDFGAARFDTSAEKTLILKIGYAPPEQYNVKSEQGPYTDIYALGATLYHVLTGIKPDESKNRESDDNAADTVAEPMTIDSNIPIYVSNTIMKAMAIEPTLRFQNVFEMEKALQKKVKVRTLEREKRARKIRRAVLGAVAACAVFAVAFVFGTNLTHKKNEVVLQPATLTVWYPEKENSKLKDAIEAVAEEFCEQQSNVKIDVVGIPYDDYYIELNSTEKEALPNLFILENSYEDIFYGNYDISENIVPKKFFDKYNSTLTKDCYFLEDYYKYFSKGGLVPLGFNVPVVYINSSEITSVPTSKKTVDDSNELRSIAEGNYIFVNPANQMQYTALYQFGTDIRTGNAKDFYEGRACIYFSSSAEYDKTEKLVSNVKGTRKILIPKSNSIPAYFSLLCGVNGFSESENLAAEAFVEFLFTDNAQTILFIEQCAEALPLNKKTAEKYAGDGFNYDFEPVYQNINRYTFENID